jgi:hypothetical protein
LSVGSFAIHRRLFVSEFIAHVRTDYRLAIWTAASRSYAATIVPALFSADIFLVPRPLQPLPQS